MANTKFLDYNGLSKLVEKIKNTYVTMMGGNEFNFIGKSGWNESNSIAFNYRKPDGTNTTTAITNYTFYNGQGKATGVSVSAENFNGNINGHTILKNVPSNAVFTDKNVYQVFDNATTSFLPLLLSPLTEDTKADEVHQTTNAKYNFSIGAVPSEGKIKATIFDGTTFTGNAATATSAITATYAKQYSYNGIDRDFVYDVVDGGNHYIRCKDATIIRANGTNLNKYEFIINSDGKGGCYIYDGANAKGTTWSPDGIVFEKAPANSLVAANGTFITAITDAEIQTEIDKAITL